MIGFKLLYPNRTIQHAGGFFVGHYGQHQPEDTNNEERYCDHITTSLAIIKKHVFDKIGLMAEDYPGDQFEDVDFTIRMKNAGFKKMYVPNKAIHYESGTKKQTIPDFNHRNNLNYDELCRRHNL
jgi:GT2 family glycosyltransferase